MSPKTATEVSKRVITPLARLSYPYLFEPAQAMQAGGQEKYQCELIFSPDADLSELRAAIEQAKHDKWGDKPPAKLRSPFRDGDTDREGKMGYDGCTFIGARSNQQPGVVIGRYKDPVVNQSDVYGGCWVKASVTAFAYDTNGNKGLSFGLNNVWKIRDGDPFGSRRSAEDDFSSEELDPAAFGEEEQSELL